VRDKRHARTTPRGALAAVGKMVRAYDLKLDLSELEIEG